MAHIAAAETIRRSAARSAAGARCRGPGSASRRSSLFALLFLILPTLDLVVGAFQTPDGDFTLENIARLDQPRSCSAYWISIQVSLASALCGALVGFFLAWAVVLGGLPRSLRPIVTTFSGVASNFAGIPLAFAFLATLGRTGLVTDASARLVRLQPLRRSASTS